MRVLSVLINNKEFTLNTNDSFGYYIEGKIELDLDSEPNKSSLILYNLSEDTLNQISENQNVIVNGGYGENVGTLFSGQISSVNFSKAPTETILELELLDNFSAWTNFRINTTYSGSLKASEVVRKLLDRFGLQVGLFELTKDITYNRGITLSGSLAQNLRRIIERDCNSYFTVTNGIVQIGKRSSRTSITVPLVNSDTNLLETPRKVQKRKNSKIKQGDYEVVCLLNAGLQPNNVFRLESSIVSGNCKVVNVVHDLDKFETIAEVQVI